jgi:hypothetical protein
LELEEKQAVTSVKVEDVYWKLLRSGRWEVREQGRVMEGVEWTKVKYTHSRDA